LRKDLIAWASKRKQKGRIWKRAG